jgi:hypothetical protein
MTKNTTEHQYADGRNCWPCVLMCPRRVVRFSSSYIYLHQFILLFVFGNRASHRDQLERYMRTYSFVFVLFPRSYDSCSVGSPAHSNVNAISAIDVPASSKQTQEQLGWRPKQAGLIADLERASYFST